MSSGNPEVISTNRGGFFPSFLLPLISFCNTLGLVGVGVIVSILFVQLQYVTYRLKSEQKQIAELQLQVQDQQAGQIQELAAQVEQQHDYTVFQIAGIFTLLTCLLTMFHMATHIRNMYEPLIQRKILAILWVRRATFAQGFAWFINMCSHNMFWSYFPVCLDVPYLQCHKLCESSSSSDRRISEHHQRFL